MANDRSISVVVPSHNHARFISSCLRSILKQTLSPAELLVIDDGSTDDSPRLIASTLKDCPFPCELIARENRGLAATLNEGLAKTRGDYFAYLGSDDLWLPEFLRTRLGQLELRPPAVLAYGHAYFVDEGNRVIDCTADWAQYSDGDVRNMLLQTIAPMSPTVVYRREALARHGWNDEARLEDYELYLRLSLDGEFSFSPEVLAAWRWHETNASWNQQMMLDEHLRALERLAPQLGITDGRWQAMKRQISFARAEDFLRIGDKRTALKLVQRNLGGAPSLATAARIGARLLLPYSQIQRRRRRRQLEATTRYGVIDD